MRFLAAALSALFVVTGCGDGGGSVAPTGPAPFLPLTWTDVPESLTVTRGETVTFTATLSAAVDASVAITATDPKVEVSGELIRAGVFEGMLTGVGYGEVVVNIVATHPDYDRADAAVDVFVDGVFNLEIWRQMVFGEGVCPGRGCNLFGLSVEERTIQVLPFSPNFHLIDEPSESAAAEGIDRFSESQRDAVEVAIRDAVEQLTGEPFAGEITSSGEPRKQRGWIDVLPVNGAWFEARGGNQRGRSCSRAGIGILIGEIAVNMECVRASGLVNLRILMMNGMGLSLGFYPITVPGDHMLGRHLDVVEDFSDDEQFHARLAHKLGHDAPYSSDPLAPAGRSAQSRGPAAPRREYLIFGPSQ